MSSTGELLQKGSFRFISSEQNKSVMMHRIQYFQMFRYFQMSRSDPDVDTGRVKTRVRERAALVGP